TLPPPDTVPPTTTALLGPRSDTPLGTFEWTIVEGRDSELPVEVTSLERVLFGHRRDGRAMTPFDAGPTWQLVDDAGGPTATIDRDVWTVEDGQLTRTTPDGTTTTVGVPSAVPDLPAAWHAYTNPMPELPALPIELDGRAHLAATTWVG